jgi:hypothetical protein
MISFLIFLAGGLFLFALLIVIVTQILASKRRKANQQGRNFYAGGAIPLQSRYAQDDELLAF